MPCEGSGPCCGRPIARRRLRRGRHRTWVLISVSQNVDEALVSSHDATVAIQMPGASLLEGGVWARDRPVAVSARERSRRLAVSARVRAFLARRFCGSRTLPSRNSFADGVRPAFAASPLRRGILRLSETRLVYRAEARRRRAKDGGPEQRQLEPDRRLAAATRPHPRGCLTQGPCVSRSSDIRVKHPKSDASALRTPGEGRQFPRRTNARIRREVQRSRRQPGARSRAGE